LTEHYHTPADEANTIDYEHLARVTRLVFGTAWQIANQDARPKSINRSQLKVTGYVCPPVLSNATARSTHIPASVPSEA
jgi:hypothetical protein